LASKFYTQEIREGKKIPQFHTHTGLMILPSFRRGLNIEDAKAYGLSISKSYIPESVSPRQSEVSLVKLTGGSGTLANNGKSRADKITFALFLFKDVRETQSFNKV